MANGHGGARKNAGRPYRGEMTQVHVYLTPIARRRLKTEAKWQGLSLSEYVETLILAKPDAQEKRDG